MKRLISIVLLIGVMTLSAGCFSIRPRMTTEYTPTVAPTIVPTKQTTAAPTAQPTSLPPTQPAASLKLVNFDGGFFSVQLPKGWQISTVGQYVTFGFRAWDPQNPDYQIFYYGKLEPFLKSNAAKQYYEDTAASLAPGNSYKMFAAAPALEPMTVESLLYSFNKWASFANSYGIVHQFTNFQNLDVSARIPYSTFFAPYATDEGIVKATFKSEQGSNCVAKFGATIVSSGSYLLSATVDTYPLAVYNISGVMAPQESFDKVEQVLTQAAFSLRFTQPYMNAAIAATQAGTADALAENAALQDIYDEANAAWDAYIRE
jgi:hypothetical protein